MMDIQGNIFWKVCFQYNDRLKERKYYIVLRGEGKTALHSNHMLCGYFLPIPTGGGENHTAIAAGHPSGQAAARSDGPMRRATQVVEAPSDPKLWRRRATPISGGGV